MPEKGLVESIRSPCRKTPSESIEDRLEYQNYALKSKPDVNVSLPDNIYGKVNTLYQLLTGYGGYNDEQSITKDQKTAIIFMSGLKIPPELYHTFESHPEDMSVHDYIFLEMAIGYTKCLIDGSKSKVRELRKIQESLTTPEGVSPSWGYRLRRIRGT